jgi:hypothetical protein
MATTARIHFQESTRIGGLASYSGPSAACAVAPAKPVGVPTAENNGNRSGVGALAFSWVIAFGRALARNRTALFFSNFDPAFWQQ